MTKKLCVFGYFGGKFMQLPFILPIIEHIKHTTYVEPFGGSAAVLLNKNPSPIEVYNDLYKDMVNFFNVLKSTEKREVLINNLRCTPYSREIFKDALLIDDVLDSDVTKAEKFFIVARQVTGGLVSTASVGRWGYAIKDSRRNMALTVSRWLSGIDNLDKIGTRLLTVQFENLDALDVIQRYDTPDTLFYLDPPYVMEARSGGKGYKHEMTNQQHSALIDVILSMKGKVVLSGYSNNIYNTRLKSWNMHIDSAKQIASLRRHNSKDIRFDCVWTNF